MADYIDREKLIRDLIDNRSFYPALVKRAIENTPIADVVPRSEVEELTKENESLAKTVNEASELIRKLRSEYEELKAKLEKQDLWEKLLKAESHAPIIAKAKQEVAREIFRELKIKSPFFCENQIAYDHFNEEIAELKKKYIGGKK